MGSMQVVEESVADDDMVMIRGSSNGAAVSVLLRGANDYMLDEMDRSLHDAFCVVKRVLESGKVVPGAQAPHILALQPTPLRKDCRCRLCAILHCGSCGVHRHCWHPPQVVGWPLIGACTDKAFADSEQPWSMDPAPRRQCPIAGS